MLRERLREELKLAMKARDQHKLSTLRLILAALKDRDIAARGNGQTDGVSDDDILQLLTKMVKQRRESIRLYEQGGRIDLAGREAEEIAIIETFLPSQLDGDDTAAAIADALASFRVAPHRAEVVGVVEGVTFVDDSKATNPPAAQASIAARWASSTTS